MLSEKKINGVYYTPELLAKEMVEWVVENELMTFFDPCFGKSIFLTKAYEKFKRIGVKNPSNQLFGVDIDPHMLASLGSGFDIENQNNFLTIDFFKLTPNDINGAPFSSICCNPPFVRHHYLTEEKLENARSAIDNIGVNISKKASYWMYFLFHCTNFLKQGGRMAIIVPSSFIFSNYSKSVRTCFFNLFKEIFVVLINGIIFDGAQETTLVIFADGYKENNEYLGLSIIDGIDSVNNALFDMSINKFKYKLDNCVDWNYNFLSPEIKSLLNELLDANKLIRLGDIASVKIGVVTGANKFFIMNENQINSYNLPKDIFYPIINRATQLKGIYFTNDSYNKISIENRNYIMLLDGYKNNEYINDYIKNGVEKKLHERYKTKNRDIWFKIDYGIKPDAFLHYMSGECPHIVINNSDYTSTNAVHKIYWKEDSNLISKEKIAFSSLSSLSQLSIELFGRSYGGGILKLEPNEAVKILLPVFNSNRSIETEIADMNDFLKKGDKKKARLYADEIILKEQLALDAKEISTIQESYESLKDIRFARSRS